MTPVFEKRALYNELDRQNFEHIPHPNLKAALKVIVIVNKRAVAEGMKIHRGKCRKAEMNLDAVIEELKMRREDIVGYVQLQEVLMRVLLLTIDPDLRLKFYRDMNPLPHTVG